MPVGVAQKIAGIVVSNTTLAQLAQTKYVLEREDVDAILLEFVEIGLGFFEHELARVAILAKECDKHVGVRASAF